MNIDLIEFGKHSSFVTSYKDLESNQVELIYDTQDDFIWVPEDADTNPEITFNFYNFYLINQILLSSDFESLDGIELYSSMDGLNWDLETTFINSLDDIDFELSVPCIYMRLIFLNPIDLIVSNISIITDYEIKVPDGFVYQASLTLFSDKDRENRNNIVEFFENIFETMESDNLPTYHNLEGVENFTLDITDDGTNYIFTPNFDVTDYKIVVKTDVYNFRVGEFPTDVELFDAVLVQIKTDTLTLNFYKK